ncbi:hypothetical protein [Terrisporobacter glycolicus]|uniref:Uncharacterized protein n=1 Tax=Terrisporobacter glycolicus ATCC 14880 = DSM 1288 TaxID=1121315 RepID=A0ABZ2EYK7_9FIRM|nr:hypothetical protein [Terrisporobacter glycolicus]
MIDININEEEKKVYIDVSGFISKREANNFLNTYKQTMKNKKSSSYKLVVSPSFFECENEDDIRTVCMAFLKTGYKKIYLVDEENYIMNNLSLKPIEKKLFLKSVKVVNTKGAIK